MMVNMRVSSTHRKRILIFVDIIEILLALIFSIHFVNCVWLFSSDNVHQELMTVYHGCVDDFNENKADTLKIE